jgi:hypothetical protein
MSLPPTVADVIHQHVMLTVECPDLSYFNAFSGGNGWMNG